MLEGLEKVGKFDHASALLLHGFIPTDYWFVVFVLVACSLVACFSVQCFSAAAFN